MRHWHLGSMAVAVAVLAWLSIAGVRKPDTHRSAMLISLWVIVVALGGGWYWSIFPRGHGFFTSNRMSAAAVFLAISLGPFASPTVRRNWNRA